MSNNEEYTAFLQARRCELMRYIAQVAGAAGRNPQDITLCAVSKTLPAEKLPCALRAGYRVFGENRVQVLQEKLDMLRTPACQSICAAAPNTAAAGNPAGVCAPVSFDMIGTLQKNKLNKLIGAAQRIQSPADADMARALNERCAAHNVRMHVLLELNISGEASKSGFSVPELMEHMSGLTELSHLVIDGLMCMAPAHARDEARACFKELTRVQARLRDDYNLSCSVLSCGMSDDFDIAIQEGSTLIRLGRILFDPQYDIQSLTQRS